MGEGVSSHRFSVWCGVLESLEKSTSNTQVVVTLGSALRT